MSYQLDHLLFKIDLANNSFIEINTGDELRLTCSDSTNEGRTISNQLWCLILQKKGENVKESVWPYVGGKHSMQCVLKLIGQGKLENKHQYFLNVTCPRCADSTAVVHAIKSSYSDRLLHNLTISSLTREDSGEYMCNWYYEHELKKTITTTIDVSPKKGQIKVDNTPQEVNVKGGDTINISAMIAAFPEDLPGFSAKWIRKFIKPPKDINETENLVTDNDHQITSEQLKGGKINEIITIKNARIEMSGIYVLTIELLDTIRTLEWRVNVQNDFISARIDIMSPNNWVVFDQKYYQTGTKLHVNCIVTAIPLAKIFFMKKRIGNSSPWMDVDQAELTAINGTYESGYLWNTTIDDDFELKCTGERNGKQNILNILISASSLMFL
uniref:Ig-like domain-containing protein n=1 Tax=Heterorhabditis bacteriophora TaxID=37862 RepID=A0A1I7XCI6_HETBA